MPRHLDSETDARLIASLLADRHVAIWTGYEIRIVCTLDGRTVAIVD